jgi:hypothetical protein
MARVAKLSTPQIEAFALDLLTPNDPKSFAAISRPLARKVLVSLKSCLRHCQRIGAIAHNPAATVKIEMPSPRREAH